jgi:hypothetical protein
MLLRRRQKGFVPAAADWNWKKFKYDSFHDEPEMSVCVAAQLSLQQARRVLRQAMANGTAKTLKVETANSLHTRHIVQATRVWSLRNNRRTSST